MRGPIPNSFGSMLAEMNDCHNPPGLDGGQFCSKGSRAEEPQGLKGQWKHKHEWKIASTGRHRCATCGKTTRSHTLYALAKAQSAKRSSQIYRDSDRAIHRYQGDVTRLTKQGMGPEDIALWVEGQEFRRKYGKTKFETPLAQNEASVGVRDMIQRAFPDLYPGPSEEVVAETPEVKEEPGLKKPTYSKAQKAFFKDLTKQGFWNPIYDRELVVGNPPEAAIEFSLRSDGSVHIHSLRAFERRRGAGTRAMQLVMGLADEHGVALTGIAKAYGKFPGAMSTSQLKQWYKKLGFTVGAGGHLRREPRT